MKLWFDNQPSDLGAIARRWFDELRNCGDDVEEVLHDDQPTACVDGTGFAYVAALAAHGNVGSFQGADLPDPELRVIRGLFLPSRVRPTNDIARKDFCVKSDFVAMKQSATHKEISCQVCGTTRRAVLRRAILVRPAVAQLIQRAVERWDENGWLCLDDLQKYQHQYVQSLLETEKGELTELELEVLKGLREHEILARNPEAHFEAARTFGQRLADQIAAFGGSWNFIMVFAVVLFGWMFVNSYVLAVRPFDPYPFILLNLVLSTLAALQAPVIMMSQNRQEARDRLRAMHDYQVNLKAELEIRQLHQKVDHLLSHQWERLVEIQEIQMELINELRGRR